MTIKEIASLAGVSISTVSKIVNNKDENINEETRNRVLKIVKEYHYTPYGKVKTLASAKTFRIGVLVSDLSRSASLLSGILAAADEHGYAVTVCDSRRSETEELKQITALCGQKTDGILWLPLNQESRQNSRYFTEASIPFLMIGTAPKEDLCSIDLQSIGHQCTQLLLNKNHKKLACIVKKESLRSESVLEGVRKCLFENHIALDDMLVSDTPACIPDLIRNKVTGVISTHYSLALDFYGEALKLHCRIPQDFSLLSLRSDQRNTESYPAVSSAAVPYQTLGYRACQSLISRCEKRAIPNDPLILAPSVQIGHEKSIRQLPDFSRSYGIVVGSINTDVALTVREPLKAGASALITHTSSCLGGKGGNQAVQAARLGQDILLIGKIGNDPEADEIYRLLQKEHLSSQGVLRDPSLQTGKAYIYPGKDGESVNTYLPGANAALTKEEIRSMEHLFEHAGFCLLSTDISPEAIEETCRLSKKYNVKLIVKPAALGMFPDSLYPYTDILIPNQKEASALTPDIEAPEEQAGYFLQKGVSAVILTLGQNGCYLRTSETNGSYLPADHVLPLDTTGGADAFAGTLASFLNAGSSLEDAAVFAQTAAGLCVSRQGSAPSMPDKNTLLAAIQKNHPELADRI